MMAQDGDRGRKASFDPKDGSVSGSGTGAGNNPGDGEEYDDDLPEAEISGTPAAPSPPD